MILPSASRSSFAGPCSFQSWPPAWISPLARRPRQLPLSSAPSRPSASLSFGPCRSRFSFWFLMSPCPLAVNVPSEVSPAWMPLPLRSIFARCALSRVASRLRLCRRLSWNANCVPCNPSLPCGALSVPATSTRPLICPRSCGQSWARRSSLISICPLSFCCRLPLPLMLLSPRRICRALRFHCSPAPSALACKIAGWPRSLPFRSRSAVRLSFSFFSSPLLRNGPARVPGSSATQYAGLIAERSSEVSQAMPSANCRFRCPSALPCPATS
ncbi:hypothetical protein D3C87_1238870 [compost metagenome]